MMTQSELFTAAHKLAKTFEGDYRACFALALKEVRKASKLTWNEEYALNRIADGCKFNGTFYTYKSGKTFIYIKNEKILIENVDAFKAQLAKNVNTVTGKKEAEIVDSKAGFSMRNTRKNWNLVAKYGYDAIEMCD